MSLLDATAEGRRAFATRLRRPRHVDLQAFSVLLVMAMMPIGDIEIAGYSVVFVAMVPPAVLAIRTLVKDEQPVPASMILAALGVGLTIGVVATAGGVNPSGALARMCIGLIVLCYAAGIALAYRPGRERSATDALVIVGGVLCAMALMGADSLTPATGGWVVEGRLTGPFAQPNELGIFCAALLPIAVSCLVTSPSRRHTVVLGAATVAIVGAWGFSMSRGAWIGGTVAVACLAVADPRVRLLVKRAGAAMTGVCVLALVAPASTPVLGIIGLRLRSLVDQGGNEYDARPLVWREAWRQATDHPWFGVGPDGYRIAATDSASSISSYGAEHPHNLYLTTLVERGVLGMAAGVVLVAGCALAARRHLRRAQFAASTDEAGSILASRSLAVIAALLAVAIHGVFDLPLRNPIVTGFVWTLLGMAIVAETARPGSAAAVASRNP